MNEPNFAAAIAYALDRLTVELPPEMTYHSLTHTRDEVIPAAVELARLARLGQRESGILRVAAAFHDLGFAERPEDHEICSARIAAQVLPAFGFDARAVEDVMSLILVTRLPQSPRNFLEALMCDADLSSLGAEEFFARSEDLLAERRAYGYEISDDDWWRDQLQFLVEHRYWTEYAVALREPQKAKNISLIRAQLEHNAV